MIPGKTRIALSLTLLALSSPALALPTGGAVVAGSATFGTSGGTLTVQNSSNAIINWQGFSIGAGETTRFNQPSASSAVLNRVVTANPSSILGSLTSNGNVFLVNPNGILFGAGSQVSVGGLTLSTSDITDANFLAGNYTFTGAGSAGITLDGTIVAPAGLTVYAGNVTQGTGNITIGDPLVVGGGGVIVTGPPITTGGGGLVTGGNISISTSGSLSLSGGSNVQPVGTLVTSGGAVTVGSGAITLSSLMGGGIADTASRGITSGGSGLTVTAAGSPIQPGGFALSNKSPALQAAPPSIPAANPGVQALTGIVTVTVVSLNLEKREVGF